mgnify:CR=1 FL=1
METIVSIIVALFAGAIIDAGAALSGNLKPFCEKYLMGTYTPAGPDVCPDGKWAALVGLRPQPK